MNSSRSHAFHPIFCLFFFSIFFFINHHFRSLISEFIYFFSLFYSWWLTQMSIPPQNHLLSWVMVSWALQCLRFDDRGWSWRLNMYFVLACIQGTVFFWSLNLIWNVWEKRVVLIEFVDLVWLGWCGDFFCEWKDA